LRFQINAYEFEPTEGKEDPQTNSWIHVKKVGDVIYPQDLQSIETTLKSRFPQGEYELMFEAVGFGGRDRVTVWVRYRQKARLQKTQTIGKFIPVKLTEIEGFLKGP
jgi:hypothetical protein